MRPPFLLLPLIFFLVEPSLEPGADILLVTGSLPCPCSRQLACRSAPTSPPELVSWFVLRPSPHLVSELALTCSVLKTGNYRLPSRRSSSGDRLHHPRSTSTARLARDPFQRPLLPLVPRMDGPQLSSAPNRYISRRHVEEVGKDERSEVARVGCRDELQEARERKQRGFV